MREIRFRAYLNDYKMIVNVDYINLYLDEIVVDIGDDQYEFHLGEYELVQYTGLKDANGKDIYEGDIVEHTYMHYAGYGFVDDITETVVIDDLRILPFDDSSVGCEVIGNKFENPELLEQSQ